MDFFYTNKFESKEHYFYVYNQLLMWLLYKGANYSTDNKYFKGISRLDELFERACYYQLFDTFVELGFTPIIDDNINFLNEANIYEKVVFEKNTFKITLYYQSLPINLTTIKKHTNNLRPDFIIEFDDLSYVILDAKYKKLNNIEKYDYENLALKYLHGIGPKEGGYLKAIALLILFLKMKLTKVTTLKRNTLLLEIRQFIHL